jgi:hypothetical protein
LIVRCRGTKRNGERCTQAVEPPNEWCWAHDPKNAEQRRRMASRAGRSKGSREVLTLKEEIKGVIDEVRAGTLERNAAAVMLQGYRALLEYVKVERGIHVEEELAAELEELKRERGRAS